MTRTQAAISTAGQLARVTETHTHTPKGILCPLESLSQTAQDSLDSEGPRGWNNSELI